MRISYSEEEDFGGQFELWQANCERSLNGRRGRRSLAELRAALVAMPEKRLIHGLLNDDSGGVCAIGALAKAKNADLNQFDPEYDNENVGVALGMPRLVAWKVVELNDIDLRSCTPEERYQRVLEWVDARLSTAGGLQGGSLRDGR